MFHWQLLCYESAVKSACSNFRLIKVNCEGVMLFTVNIVIIFSLPFFCFSFFFSENEEVQGDGVATAGLYICFYGNIYDISYASDTDLS